MRELATRLAQDWPPARLAQLLDELHTNLCVDWGDCTPLGDPADFASPALNDLDSFAAAVLAQLGRDSTASSNRAVTMLVADTTLRFFGQPSR